MSKKRKAVQVSLSVDVPCAPSDEALADLQERFCRLLVKINKNERARRLIELPTKSSGNSRP